MRRIWNKRTAGQREGNGKGARSQPLLMQITAKLKESRESKKCFLMLWWTNTDVRDLKSRERVSTYSTKEFSGLIKKTIVEFEIPVISTLCTHLDLE